MAVQHLDLRGRPGLLRTVLEAQETRGLTRSDDISRLLPSEVPPRLRRQPRRLHLTSLRHWNSRQQIRMFVLLLQLHLSAEPT